MPLRTRLVLILLLLVAGALAAIEAITYNAIRSSLVSTVDSQMKTSISVWTEYFDSCDEGCNPSLQAFEQVQPDTYGALYDSRGNLVKFPPSPQGAGNPAERCTSCNESVFSHPVLPANFVVNALSSRTSYNWGTATGTHGVRSYRILATILSSRFGNQPFVLVVAFPLTGVGATMGHILTLELVIGGAILAALAVASWFLVRLSLRPLERMAATASEIAAGDLTRRVEDTDERTEVGQLGGALNVMLSQIERAFREREASEQQLRRFVGDASHELRTPLTSIRGYAELFKDGVADHPEDLAAALRRIESESARMGGLVDDLLLLARLDQGRPLRHDRVDLAQLAADAVQDASVVDPSRSIRLIATGPSYVIGDDQRLRQVLGNLVSNAVAYSPAGSPIEVAVHMDRVPESGTVTAPAPAAQARVRTTVGSGGPAAQPGRPLGPTDLSAPAPGPATGPVTAVPGVPGGTADPAGTAGLAAMATQPGASASIPDGLIGAQHTPGRFEPPKVPVDPATPPPWVGPRAAIAVIDHGPGIPADDVPHVFERFWRADPSRKRAGGGSGLGLSIVAAVVGAHRGRVTIRQTPGGGATFVVELPAGVGPAAADNGSIPEEPTE